MKFLLATLLLALTFNATAQDDDFNPFAGNLPAEKEKTQIELIPESASIAPGQTITLAIQLTHAEGWHAYYRNPGGPGLPLDFDWTLPEGYSLKKIHWPTPHQYTSGGTQFYAYEGTYALLADIAVPDSATVGSEAEIKVDASWQICDANACLPPESKELSVKLAVTDTQVPDMKRADYFENARAQIPQPSTTWEVSAESKDGKIILNIKTVDGSIQNLGKAHFIPDAAITDANKEQELRDTGDQYILLAPLQQGTKPSNRVSGIIAGKSGPGFVFDAALAGADAAATGDMQGTPGAGHGLQNEAPSEADIAQAAEMYDANSKIDFVLLDGTKEKSHNLLTALGFIFIGGFLLNLMPCVFPVLGIKVMGFAQQAGSDPGKIKLHGLVFMAGLVVSMWILAGIIYVLIYTFGRDINWGEQLTSPVFLAAMIMLLYLFGLNMAGLFEIGTSLTGAGGELQAKKGYSGSFFSGVLTTLIATPCSGPFLGSVMGYTLDQPPLQGMIIFTVFALGIALPYVVLAFFPKLINKLPKPGAWMVTFKQLMSFALFATAAYFFRSFAKITGTGGASWLLMAIVIVGLAAWAYGRFGTPYTPKFKKFAWGVGFPLLVATGAFFMTKSATEERAPAPPLTGASWYPGVVELNRSKGRIVWVDHTADW